MQPSRNRKLSSKARRKGWSKTRVGDRTGKQSRRCSSRSRTLVRQAGLEGWLAAQAAGWLEGSAEGISGRWESEVRFEGGTGRLNEGASRKSAGRLSRKITRRRKLEIGRKADRKIGKRRKSQVDAKVGPESWPETRVEGWLKGGPEGWSPTQVGGWSEGKSKDLTVGKGR